MAFNFHHDYIPFTLIFQLEISRQTAKYKSIIKNTLKARQWLDRFWEDREALELNILEE